MKLPIYLDYSATTPVDPRVAEKMMKYLTLDGVFGNPASRTHYYGWQAEEAVDIARNQVADLMNAESCEIIFTSGATESNNLAIKGVAHALKDNNKGRHIITSLTEHKTVLDTCMQLKQESFTVTCLVPSKTGVIYPQQLNDALRDDTILVSLMHVNNETGIMQNIKAFGEICHAYGILFHVDATQSIGKISINLTDLPVDLMSFSGHKLYGPKGIGGLFIRYKAYKYIKAQIHGGNNERGIRPGTLPVHQIVGMGEAYNIAAQEMMFEIPRQRTLRDRLWQGLQQIDGVSINGNLQQSVATLLNVSFRNINGESLIIALKDLAISTGSACTSAGLEPSYVLRAMGLNNEIAQSSLRFSLGRFTTSEEIDYAIKQTQIAVFQLRKRVK